MKYYIDTEFIEKPNIIQLISVGIVAEDGREYYAICSEYKYSDANEWVRKNVLRQLFEDIRFLNKNRVAESHRTVANFQHIFGKSMGQIGEEIIDFIGNDTPEFWGYYSDYDWVVFCWCFGCMVDLPTGWPMYCKDLKQLADNIDKPKFSAPKGEHNALIDARWNMKFHKYLCGN